jgi:glutaminase
LKKDFPDLQSTLETLHQKYLPLLEGHTADYIPELSKANTDHFAIVVATVDGTFYKVGDWDKNFTMQSTSKPFVYGLALQDIGHQKMLCKIGVEPTGEAFNSIIELEKESHRPYNPMINSGAIAVSSLINGSSANERLKRIKELQDTETALLPIF